MTFARLTFAIVVGLAASEAQFEEQASHAAKECVQKDGVYWGLTRPMFMDQFMGSIEIAMHEEMKMNPQFRTTVTQAMNCQYTCAGEVFFESAKVIHGSKLLLPGHRTVAKAFVQGMLTGAIKTCYPHSDFNATLATSEKILDAMVEPIVGYHPPEPKIARICPGHPNDLSPTAYTGYQMRFRECMDSTMEDIRYAKIRNYVRGSSGYGFSCQLTCFQNAGQLAFANLFKSGIFGTVKGHEMLAESMTGATRACFPTVHRSQVIEFWHTVINCMSHSAPKNTCLPLDDKLSVDGQEMGVATFEDEVEKSAKCAVNEVAQSNPRVKKLFTDSGSCQLKTCLPAILKTSAHSLFRTKLIIAPAADEYGENVLTGALKACYPTVEQDDAREIARKINRAMTRQQGGACQTSDVVPSSECPGKPEGGKEEDFEKVKTGLGAKLDAVQTSNRFVSLKNWLHQNSFDCQQTCLHENLKSSLENLWTAGLFAQAECHANLASAFSGVIQSCYPRVPASETNAFADIIDETKDMDYSEAQKVVDGTPASIETKISAKECPGKPEHTDKDDYVEFIKDFGDSFQQTLKRGKFADLEKHVQSGSYTCQESCLNSVIAKSMQTLWQSGLFGSVPNHAMFVNAFTGAVRTCFPELPLDQVHSLATESLQQLEADENSRKYSALFAKQQAPAAAEASMAPKFFLGAVGASVAVAAVVMLVRSSRRAGTLRRMVLAGSESFVQIDSENGGLE
jgi:hypothetical protein